jgi:hypothetical protein
VGRWVGGAGRGAVVPTPGREGRADRSGRSIDRVREKWTLACSTNDVDMTFLIFALFKNVIHDVDMT